MPTLSESFQDEAPSPGPHQPPQRIPVPGAILQLLHAQSRCFSSPLEEGKTYRGTEEKECEQLTFNIVVGSHGIQKSKQNLPKSLFAYNLFFHEKAYIYMHFFNLSFFWDSVETIVRTLYIRKN